jgi:hypothetical protein
MSVTRGKGYYRVLLELGSIANIRKFKSVAYGHLDSECSNNKLLTVIADAPVRAGTNPETAAAAVIAVTLSSTFVRSCKDWERPRLVAT